MLTAQSQVFALDTAAEDIGLPGCQNRRRNGRVNRNFTVRYRTGGLLFHPGRALSVGVSGARILATDSLSQGDRVHLTMELEEGWTVAVPGRVVWTKTLGATCVAGVAFTDLWRDDEDRLQAWVDRNQAC